MKLILSILLLIMVTFFVVGQQKVINDHSMKINLIQSDINDIKTKSVSKKEFDDLHVRVEYQQKLYDQTISSISAQLDSANFNLTLFGILFGIMAIVLGIYVTYVERKIVKISEDNSELLSKNQRIKKEVEDLNQLIQSDINGLYLKIKKEETEHLLLRLKKVPQDISNLSHLLLSRELIPDNYSALNFAYHKLEENDERSRNEYHILFFQHFFNIILNDAIIRNSIFEFIPKAIKSSFKNDIINSTSSFIIEINQKGLPEYGREVNIYFKGLSDSEYKNSNDVYNTFINELKDRSMIFELFNLVESNAHNRIAKIAYGKLMREKYASEILSDVEKGCFEELGKLIADQPGSVEASA